MNLIPVKRISHETSPHITDEEGAAMARAVIQLFKKWQLSSEEACVLLGGIASATYSRWKKGQISRLSPDCKTRLSNLMGIHKSLRILFTDNLQGYAWVKKRNKLLNGQSALDIMLNGQITDLMRVRRLLDAARG